MLNKEQKRIVFLSAMGGMLEFYDFTIYGLFAVYFANQFFPSDNHFTAIIASYAVFLIGYIARPLGGIIFSHIGDEIGRRTVLILTMILMGTASLGLGLLPNYESIGIWAPIMMTLLRLLQGLAIGGELPSMIVYATESIPNQRCLAMGGIFAGTCFGLIPGMLINLYITHYLTIEQLNRFGWRIPFLLGGLLCLVAYQVRRKLHETKAFNGLKQRNTFPLAELIRHHFGKLMIGVGISSIVATDIILAIIFMPTYLTKVLKFNPEQISGIIFFTASLSVASIYVMGLISGRFSIYTLTRNCMLFVILAGGCCYFMLSQEYNLIIALSLFALFQGALVIFPPILLSYLFPVQIRLTGVALAYNLAMVLFGALTPIVTTTMIEHTQMLYMSPFICLFVAGLVALFALRQAKKYLPNSQETL